MGRKHWWNVFLSHTCRKSWLTYRPNDPSKKRSFKIKTRGTEWQNGKRPQKKKKCFYKMHQFLLSSHGCPIFILLFIHLCRLEHIVSVFAVCLHCALDDQDPLHMDLCYYRNIWSVDWTKNSDPGHSFNCIQNTCLEETSLLWILSTEWVNAIKILPRALQHLQRHY